VIRHGSGMNTFALSTPQPAVLPLLVSEKEAGRLLGVTARTVYQLRRDGELSAIRIGSRVLYSRDDLTAFIAKRRQTGAVRS
jgi:excisionase family DNA binding protein